MDCYGWNNEQLPVFLSSPNPPAPQLQNRKENLLERSPFLATNVPERYLMCSDTMMLSVLEETEPRADTMPLETNYTKLRAKPDSCPRKKCQISLMRRARSLLTSFFQITQTEGRAVSILLSPRLSLTSTTALNK